MDTIDLDATVDHPPHYNSHPSGVECIQITEHMGFNLGNAIKYIWRADLKGSSHEDLNKARWYIDREIKRRELVEQHAQDALFEETFGDGEQEFPAWQAFFTGAVPPGTDVEFDFPSQQVREDDSETEELHDQIRFTLWLAEKFADLGLDLLEQDARLNAKQF